MSDNLRAFEFNLEGEIVLESLIPVNTSGAFCDLLTATHPTAGKLALKRPRGDWYDESVMARIEIEASVWVVLRHPRILQFLGIYKIGEEIYLVSPFAENSSLPGFLNARPGVDRRRLVVEIAEGLAYLHQCGVIHGDLKGNNVLVSKDEHILLCDFGLAKHVTSRTSTSLRGTGSIPWQSPELLRDASRRTFQSDVYAFGITIYEVLSSKEPYVDYSGIGSIIAGVLFSAERPPKEPLAAPDGTSYLQLWHEASKCWDEDPALRPSIASVLTRLDHKIAEELITTQQIALETSLDPPVDIGPMSRSPPISDGAPPMAKVLNTTDTLVWANSIRSRLTTFMNSKQPISRMTPALLASIILRDSTEVKLRYNHPLQFSTTISSEGRSFGTRISRMLRFMQLRLVSRAWRLAVDTSTHLWSLVWVGNDRNNVEYVQHRNSDGPLDCVISQLQSTLPLSILQPIAYRISQIAIISPSHYTTELLKALAFPKLTQLYFRSMWFEMHLPRNYISFHAGTNSMIALVLDDASFPGFQHTIFSCVHTIKIVDTAAHDTFIPDFFAVLSASPNLTELVLERLTSRPGLHASTPSRVTHRGLQRMRLLGIPSPILSALLLCLDMENVSSIFVNGIEPSQLPSPDSAFAKTIRSLLQATHSPDNNGELWLVSAVRPDENLLVFKWPSINRAFVDEPLTTWETWDFNVIRTSHLSNENTTKLFHGLFDLGIKVDGVTLELNDSLRVGGQVLDRSLGVLSHESPSWLEMLARLDSVRRIFIRVSVLDAALKHLSEPVPGVVDGTRWVCPHLTHLEVLRQFYNDWPENPSMFREQIGRRQQAADSLDGPAKLLEIGVPEAWIDQINGNDPVFGGAEIYSVHRLF